MDVSGSMDANNNPEHIPRFDFEFREDEMDLKGLACQDEDMIISMQGPKHGDSREALDQVRSREWKQRWSRCF